ncbi:MAG: ABC transporter ATP-binding protein [Clostridia bacterium]|nr:ABC transporter ATP-binding protein [Clostridia bacterium]
MIAIEVKELVKTYGELKAVDDVSLRIKEGEIFGLLGPNGAGKSTLMECMAGLKKYDKGQILIEGQDVNQLGKKLYNTIGVQLQETAYPEHLKVKELCKWFSDLYEKPADYNELLKKFHLSDKANNYVNTLSGGQRQKIAIILALIGKPHILFLDELTTGLDPNSKKEMWAEIKALKEVGLTIFLTTHNMEEASYLCDQIAVLDEGKLLLVDTLDQVIASTQLNHEVSFKAGIEEMQQLKSVLKIEAEVEFIQETVKVSSSHEDLITHVVLALNHYKIPYEKIQMKSPTLEDAYLKLTGKYWEV